MRNSTSPGPRPAASLVKYGSTPSSSVYQRLAKRQGIPQKDVACALEGYADDMLSDLKDVKFAYPSRLDRVWRKFALGTVSQCYTTPVVLDALLERSCHGRT